MLAKPQSLTSIDLSAYAEPRRGAFSYYGFHCVYVITRGAGKPCKIGIARDPTARLRSLQTGQPEKLRVDHLLWVPTAVIASAIERDVHRGLKKTGSHVTGEWFDIAPHEAARIVRSAAEKLFPSIEFLDHEQMIALVDTEGFGKRAANYSEQERNLLVRALNADPLSPVLPKLGIHVWAELINPTIQVRINRFAA
jgi:hypothetical protein